jgi:hypothetical protein
MSQNTLPLHSHLGLGMMSGGGESLTKGIMR